MKQQTQLIWCLYICTLAIKSIARPRSILIRRSYRRNVSPQEISDWCERVDLLSQHHVVCAFNTYVCCKAKSYEVSSVADLRSVYPGDSLKALRTMTANPQNMLGMICPCHIIYQSIRVPSILRPSIYYRLRYIYIEKKSTKTKMFILQYNGCTFPISTKFPSHSVLSISQR